MIKFVPKTKLISTLSHTHTDVKTYLVLEIYPLLLLSPTGAVVENLY